jgi:hypothetical protein
MKVNLTRKLAAAAATVAIAAGISAVALSPAHAAMTTFSYQPSVSCLDDAVTPAGYPGYTILTLFSYTSDYGSSTVILATTGFSTYLWNNGWQLRNEMSAGQLMIPGVHSVTADTSYWNGSRYAHWNTFNLGAC